MKKLLLGPDGGSGDGSGRASDNDGQRGTDGNAGIQPVDKHLVGQNTTVSGDGACEELGDDLRGKITNDGNVSAGWQKQSGNSTSGGTAVWTLITTGMPGVTNSACLR